MSSLMLEGETPIGRESWLRWCSGKTPALLGERERCPRSDQQTRKKRNDLAPLEKNRKERGRNDLAPLEKK
jgi:hypothetical protein